MRGSFNSIINVRKHNFSNRKQIYIFRKLYASWQTYEFITVQLDPHLWRFLGLQRIRALISKRRQPVFLSSPLQVADVVFELLQHMVCKTLNYALSMGKGLCDRNPRNVTTDTLHTLNRRLRIPKETQT